MIGICGQCLDRKHVFHDNRTNMNICNECFGKRYDKKGKPKNPPKKQLTLNDLKAKWEYKNKNDF